VDVENNQSILQWAVKVIGEKIVNERDIFLTKEASIGCFLFCIGTSQHQGLYIILRNMSRVPI
jgi:hypothetical protein